MRTLEVQPAAWHSSNVSVQVGSVVITFTHTAAGVLPTAGTALRKPTSWSSDRPVRCFTHAVPFHRSMSTGGAAEEERTECKQGHS